MRRGLLTFVLLLLTAVTCGLAIPQYDLPETSYDETDTPVNQAAPSALGIRFVRPSQIPTVLPRRAFATERHLPAPAHELVAAVVSPHTDAHSLRDLICTLLI